LRCPYEANYALAGAPGRTDMFETSAGGGEKPASGSRAKRGAGNDSKFLMENALLLERSDGGKPPLLINAWLGKKLRNYLIGGPYLGRKGGLFSWR